MVKFYCMKIFNGLQLLIDDGVIDQVLCLFKSGKEVLVYVVCLGEYICCVKVYKDMVQCSFQQCVQYQEGCKVCGSCEVCVMGKVIKFGCKEVEVVWKNVEVDVFYLFNDVGVCVFWFYGYFNGVLLMELVIDEDG